MKTMPLVTLAALIFASCSQRSTPSSDQSQEVLTAKRWYLKSIHVDSTDLNVPDSIAFIKFDSVKMSAGGKGGCNSFGSNYSIEGSTIRFTELFSTKMFCEQTQEIENKFFMGLNRVNHYHIDGHTLHLKENDKILLELVHGSE